MAIAEPFLDLPFHMQQTCGKETGKLVSGDHQGEDAGTPHPLFLSHFFGPENDLVRLWITVHSLLQGRLTSVR